MSKNPCYLFYQEYIMQHSTTDKYIQNLKSKQKEHIDINIFLIDEGMFQYCTPSVCFNLRKKSGKKSSLVSNACES